MASLGHLAIGMAAGRLQGGGTLKQTGASMLLYSALSYLPDLDTVGFALGIPYGAPFGHRGAFHSLGFALGAAAAIGVAAHLLKGSGWRTGALAAAVLASHGLLDTLTDGGRGIALFWPWTTERVFAPWRPIPVAPIGAAVLSPWGLSVLGWELKAFAPLFALALWPRFRKQQTTPAP